MRPISFLSVILLVMTLGLAGATFTGCNTVEGMGRDIQAAGEGIDDAMDDD